MKIISGKYKGRKILGYDIVGTRPTMDRVKESVIAIIQNRIKDSVCLDLFAGTGSFGLELISNGASHIVFVDNNKKVIETLSKNLENINISESYDMFECDYKMALKKIKNMNFKFDIIFLDPPYELHIIEDSIDSIRELKLLNDNGIIICEYETEEIKQSGFKVLKNKVYGSKKIMILEKLK